MTRACLTALLGASLVVACDGDPASRGEASSQTGRPKIELAIPRNRTGERLNVYFEHTDCTTDGGVTTVKLSRASAAATDQRDLLFLARFDAEQVFDAHVWVPEEVLDHADGVPWVQIVAADVPGANRDCRVSAKGNETEVVCNKATLVPWTDVGVPPTPSFRVKFSCR